MNIFLRELKANFKSLIIWGVIVILFVTVGIAKFSAYYENPELLAILDGMPQGVLEALNFKAFNLTTITGFYGVMFVYFALMLSISAAMWGSDIIAKEENNKTVEFALTLPVKRSTLITAKTLAALVNCIGLALITLGITLVNVPKYKPDAAFYDFLTTCTIALFIMQLLFLAVGVFLGCAMKQHRRAGSVAVSILLVTYFLSIMSGLDKNLDFLKYFTPFKYFDPGAMMNDGKIGAVYLALSAGIIAVCLVGAYVSYAKRDLYI
jgi:ABC-2 type transport system permease protein